MGTIDDKVEPHIRDADRVIWSETLVNDEGTNIYLFNLCRGPHKFWPDTLRQKVYLKAFEFIKTETMRLVNNNSWDIDLNEVRFAVRSSEETAVPYGNAPVLYLFSNIFEPEATEKRKQVWDFLRELQIQVNSELHDWAMDSYDMTVRYSMHEVMLNMAIFAVFKDGGFMGGWSLPVRLDQYKDRDPGKPEKPAAPDQNWDDCPVNRNEFDSGQNPTDDW